VKLIFGACAFYIAAKILYYTEDKVKKDRELVETGSRHSEIRDGG
jgi:hypothetical protein